MERTDYIPMDGDICFSRFTRHALLFSHALCNHFVLRMRHASIVARCKDLVTLSAFHADDVHQLELALEILVNPPPLHLHHRGPSFKWDTCDERVTDLAPLLVSSLSVPRNSFQIVRISTQTTYIGCSFVHSTTTPSTSFAFDAADVGVPSLQTLPCR